jgi:uncharacterized protein YbaR (Trm112 family)
MSDKKLHKELVEILACPVDKLPLKYNKKENTLKCKNKHTYKVKEGIPILLPPKEE